MRGSDVQLLIAKYKSSPLRDMRDKERYERGRGRERECPLIAAVAFSWGYTASLSRLCRDEAGNKYPNLTFLYPMCSPWARSGWRPEDKGGH